MKSCPLTRALAFTLSTFLIQLTACFAAEPAPASIDGPIAWKFATGMDVTAAPVVQEGVVYCGSTNGQFFALDAAAVEV